MHNTMDHTSAKRETVMFTWRRRSRGASRLGKWTFRVAQFACILFVPLIARADHLRDLQTAAVEERSADWGHWGPRPEQYSSWVQHTNRLIPVYTFGITLDSVRGENNPYRDGSRLRQLYGRLPDGTLNPAAEYFDQTGIYELQQAAAAAGKKYIILIIFDGMDWQTSQAAAIYYSRKVGYQEGRGSGLAIMDYRGAPTDFGYFVTSPANHGTSADPDSQTVKNPGGRMHGGFDPTLAGAAPWESGPDPLYIAGTSKQLEHAWTDSAASATSMNSGIKTYNNAVNVDPAGRQVEPISRQLQQAGYAIGVLTSVPISHATPACAYANNVARYDYQDLSRDLLGLPSISHPDEPLPGVDVLIGAGWGVEEEKDVKQGENFVPGNPYLTEVDRNAADVASGGRYRIVQRTAGMSGKTALQDAARQAAAGGERLLGFFGFEGGHGGGHLPFRTADGNFNPPRGPLTQPEEYDEADVNENPTLADMTTAALEVLATNPTGFWLMIEAGDVDWANHDNNIDNSIGAVKSGDDAFRAVTDWVEKHDAWQDTVVIVTADHGHYLVLEKPEALIPPEEER